jgi:hypothetical protein
VARLAAGSGYNWASLSWAKVHAAPCVVFTYSLPTCKAVLIRDLFSEKRLPKNTFQPKNRFPQTVYRSILFAKRKHIKAPIFFKLILGEQLGNFHKTTPLNNFSTVRPIFTNNILIHLSQQRDQNQIINILIIPF